MSTEFQWTHNLWEFSKTQSEYEGEKNRLLWNVPLWNVNYFKLKSINPEDSGNTFTSPLTKWKNLDREHVLKKKRKKKLLSEITFLIWKTYLYMARQTPSYQTSALLILWITLLPFEAQTPIPFIKSGWHISPSYFQGSYTYKFWFVFLLRMVYVNYKTNQRT